MAVVAVTPAPPSWTETVTPRPLLAALAMLIGVTFLC